MYKVDWLQSALDELARCWMAADPVLRPQITEAAHRIEQQLRAAPFDYGESRDAGARICFDSPLVIHYGVNVRLHVVTIGRVGQMRYGR